jgi:hypothetical protein
LDRLLVVGVDAASDEWDLGRQIDIVGSGGRAGSYDRKPVGRIGSHGADHDAGLGGKQVQGFAGVDDDQWPAAGLIGERLAQAVQPLGRPADRPTRSPLPARYRAVNFPTEPVAP